MNNLFILYTLIIVLTCGGCENKAKKLSRIGQREKFAPMHRGTLESQEKNETQRTSSLWQPGNKMLTQDYRASRIGDFLTVVIDLTSKAHINNTMGKNKSSQRSNNVAEGALNSIRKLVGMDKTSGPLIDTKSKDDANGNTARDEQAQFRIAVSLVKEFSNGHFLIHGKQQIIINEETRYIEVHGIIRKEDIEPDNTIPYDRISEIRLVYSGHGQTYNQSSGMSTQILDEVMPFS